MSATFTVRMGWEHPETEEAFKVECTVMLGTPRPAQLTPESRWVPGDEDATVEVLEVVEDRPGGVDRPELVEVAADDERLIDDAIERASDLASDDGEDGRPDTREEASLDV
jgi:hypothetical protein